MGKRRDKTSVAGRELHRVYVPGDIDRLVSEDGRAWVEEEKVVIEVAVRKGVERERNQWRSRALEAEDRAKRLEHELERAVESREYWQDSHAAALKLALRLAA